MTGPMVSVIMPAYNCGNFIDRSITSVINQVYTNWELIIVDDGSTDHTASVVQEYCRTDKRIFYYHQQNGKQGKARNNAIARSRGSIIAFLDADDWWREDKLAVQISVLQNNKRAVLVFSQGYRVTGEEAVPADIIVKDSWDEKDIPLFLQSNRIPILSVIIKKESLEAVGKFTEIPALQNAEDYHLWMKLLLEGHTFISIPDRLYYYRVHESQSTFGQQNLVEAQLTLYKDLYEHYTFHKCAPQILSRLSHFLDKYSYRAKLLPVFNNIIKKKSLPFFLLESVAGLFSAKWQNRLIQKYIHAGIE